jgi:hypothetical protein
MNWAGYSSTGAVWRSWRASLPRRGGHIVSYKEITVASGEPDSDDTETYLFDPLGFRASPQMNEALRWMRILVPRR